MLMFHLLLCLQLLSLFTVYAVPDGSQLFSKIVRADYPPIDSTLYNEYFGNLVAHLLMPDPDLRPKITLVR